MKKLLLLLMTAMLCFGCSKSTVQGDIPAADRHEAKVSAGSRTEPLNVVFHHQMSPTPGFISRSYIEYTDENGMLQTLYPEPQTLSYQIRVAKDGYMVVHVDLSYRYDMVYASISTDVFINDSDHVDIYRRCIRGDTPLVGTYTIPVSLFNTTDSNIQDELASVNIFLRGDETARKVIPDVGECYDSN